MTWLELANSFIERKIMRFHCLHKYKEVVRYRNFLSTDSKFDVYCIECGKIKKGLSERKYVRMARIAELREEYEMRVEREERLRRERDR